MTGQHKVEIAEIDADPDIVPVRRMRALDFDCQTGCEHQSPAFSTPPEQPPGGDQ